MESQKQLICHHSGVEFRGSVQLSLVLKGGFGKQGGSVKGFSSTRITRQCRPTIYAAFALWCRCHSTLPQGKRCINCLWSRCRSTIPQGKQRINCGWPRRY